MISAWRRLSIPKSYSFLTRRSRSSHKLDLWRCVEAIPDLPTADFLYITTKSLSVVTAHKQNISIASSRDGSDERAVESGEPGRPKQR